MLSFFIKGGCNIIRTAAKNSVVDTGRAISAVGLVFGASYLYSKTTSLVNQRFFKTQSNTNKTDAIKDNSSDNLTLGKLTP